MRTFTCRSTFLYALNIWIFGKYEGKYPLIRDTPPPLCEGVVHVRGASEIKLKKVNKKRTVTVRRVIIILNISSRPLWICLHCCLHQHKTLKAVATAMAMIVLLTPAKNLNKVLQAFLVVSPLFKHYQEYV